MISEGLRRASLLCHLRYSATFLWGPNTASVMQVDSLIQTCVLSATFFISLHLFSHRGEGCSYTLIILTFSNTGIFYRKKKTLLECQSVWVFIVLSRRGFKVYVKEVHKEISKFTDKGLGKYSPLFLISDYRGYARAEESMMQMIWCKGALSIITGHFHRHELIYQEERLAQSLFKLYLYQQPIHCHCQRLCWLRTRRELELLPWVSVIINQRLRGMMRDRSWEPWWHPHTSVYIKM